ncbi:MAG TPA: aminopeptidase P family protein, partial [Ruminiclostridium sp.]|nr:aminopeptidase P family protein [Ruminiclostridium sp.]
MNDMVLSRITVLQQALKNLGLDAAVIMDRENLIYFANIEDVEGGSLIVPAEGEPKLICLWLDARHFREKSELDVIPYFFPEV